MNFGLRNDRNKLELQARYGQYFDHGHTKLDSGKSRQIAGTAGYRHRRDRLHRRRRRMVQGRRHQPRRDPPDRAHLRAAESRTSPTSCPIIRCRCRSGASRRSTAGRRMLNSGIDVTEQQPALPDGARRLQQGERELQLPLADHARRGLVDVAGITHTLGANGAFSAPFFLTPCPAGNATCPAGGYVQDNNTFLFTDHLSGRLHAALRRHHQGTVGHGRLEGRARRRPDLGPVGHARQEHARPCR